MRLLEDGIIAALSAIGLVTVLYLMVSAFVRPRKGAVLDAAVIVPCGGDAGARLEQTVRTLERSRYEYGGFRRIVILDRGMNEAAQKAAALLCRDDYDVTICNDLSKLYELE